MLSLINHTEMTQFLSFQYPVTRDKEREWLQNLYDDTNKMVFGIVPADQDTSEDDILVGTIGLHEIDYLNSRATLGIMVRPDSQQRGYASNAYKLILDYAFSHLNLERVFADIKSFNTPSMKMHEKLGFSHVSSVPKCYKIGSQYADNLIYMLERTDWENQDRSQK